MLTRLKRIGHRIPFVPKFYQWYTRRCFRNSQSYWEQRYVSGGNSGEGSYGRLAQFKAEVLNQFVCDHDVASVVEFGCGDGNQLSLAEYPQYTGLDVSLSAIELCRRRFSGDVSKRFMVYDAEKHDKIANDLVMDLSLSLDVIYHLVEDSVFDTYMQHLFASARRFVIIYSSNNSNAGPTAAHVRHRCFSDWVSEKVPNWQLKEKIPNRYPIDTNDPETSFADFFVFEKTTG